MTDIDTKFDVTEENFKTLVLESSHHQPVLVDFWASWCAPCQTLMPLLEKLAKDYGGKFLLAKINADEQQALTTQYQVKSLPSVKLFVNGEVVDEFLGIRGQAELRNFLNQHLTRKSDLELELALEKITNGETEDAKVILEQAHQTDPSNAKITIELALLYVQSQLSAKAEKLYLTLEPEHKDSQQAQQLFTYITLSKERAEIMNADEAIKILKQQPPDSAPNPEALYSYSLELIFKKQYTQAMDNLLKLLLINQQYRKNIAQKTLIEIYKIIDEQPEIVQEYRRKMAKLLN